MTARNGSGWLKVVIVGILLTAASRADVTGLVTFSPGTPIRSADVNGNFAALNKGKQDKLAFFTVTQPNSDPRLTIDNPACNYDPNAFLIVTHRAASGQLSPPVGVVFYQPTGRWLIFSEDNSNLPAGNVYNVLVVK